MKRSLWPAGVAALIVAGLAAFAWVHRADIPILNPQGPVAFGERNVILMAALLPMIVVIPVFFLLFYFAWKYRANGPDAHKKHQPNWDHDSALAEASWWLVPAAIILVLGMVAWQSSHELDPYKPLAGNSPTLNVEVIALDWKWLFLYPQQGIATVNELVIPQNTPVHFLLTADAPMNSFWIPSLGGQIMVMPGMQTQLNLMATNLGNFNGYSANISGNGFAGMAFMTKSVSQDDFNAWVASVKEQNNPLTSAVYAALAKPSEYVPVTTYSSVEPSLYDSVIMNEMMPGSGNMQMQDSMPMASSTMQGMAMPMQMGRTTTGASGANAASAPEASSSSAAAPTGPSASMPMMPQNMQMNGSSDILMQPTSGTS